MTGAFLHPFAKPAAAASSFTTMVRGEGALVWDANGRRYVDGMASLWHCNIGHGRTEVAEAVAAQIGALETYHCFDRFSNAPADELADRLVQLAPVANSRVFLTSGGSEAVDSAIKLARLAQALSGHPDRTMIVSRTPSYHGFAYGGMTLTGLPNNRAHFGPGMGDAVQVPKDDLDAVRAVFTEHPDRVAAVFAEPVIGAGGVYPPADGYLQELRALCDEQGAYLVLDEVICGFGRLGAWSGGEHYGVQADLTTFAKGVTSGYVPLGGVLLAPSVHEALSADPTTMLMHGYTYSGHATACAAALACLDITEREGLLQHATEIGKRLSEGLQGLGEDGLVAEVRGAGAMWAVQLHPGVDAVAVRDRVLDAGVIVRPIGSALAMCPPLVITDEEVDAVLGALREAL